MRGPAHQVHRPHRAPVPSCLANEASPPPRIHVTYDELHSTIRSSLVHLHENGWGSPDWLVAIAGGGLIPARILRSMLRTSSKDASCAAIKVIGLELYDDSREGKVHEQGVIRTQWLEASTQLLGKRILIVDEVDDSRQTLAYAVRELQADIRAQECALAAEGKPVPATHLAVFVVHNKLQPKKAQLPEGVPQFVAKEVEGGRWIRYPYDVMDIDEHNILSSSQQ